ncbi:quinone oxidoreductase family protein [Microbacterium esteraromaticum]|nr:NADP-dependent oxidoreductase [Microbacterium esteraromaticum]
MNAFVLASSGAHAPEFASVAVPQVGERELLVRIMAVGVGIHDSYFLPGGMAFPFPIGIEAAGIVEAIGAGVDSHKVSDRIAFVSMMQPKGGVWAEYAVISVDSLILPMPDAMTFEQAAAVPVAGNTALRALRALTDLPDDGSLFIAGASGAVGTFAVQLANQRGWAVAASASPRNHDYLIELGARLAVDYHEADWSEDVLRWSTDGVDGAIAIQPNTTASSMRVVKSGGAVVTVSADQVESAGGVHVTGLAYGADVRSELDALMDDIMTDRITLKIEQVYPFAEADRALAKVQTRRARGKIVLSLSA